MRIHVLLIGIGAALAALSCVKLPTTNNSKPDAPRLRLSADSLRRAEATACTLWVSGTDPDGDELAFQIEVGNPETGYVGLGWTGYFPDGTELTMSLAAIPGDWEVRAYTRDPQNSQSPPSAASNLYVEDSPPGTPSRPSGDSIVFSNLPAHYSSRVTDPDNDRVTYRVRVDTSIWIDWHDLQSGGQFEFTLTFYTYSALTTHLVSVQCADEWGQATPWSEPLTVSVGEGWHTVGSCSFPNAASEMVSDDRNVYVSTYGQGIETASIAQDGYPTYIGSSDSLYTTEMGFNSHAVFVIATVNGRGGLQAIDMSDPTSPRLAGFFPVNGVRCIDVEGNLALMGMGDVGQTIVVLDVSNLDTLVRRCVYTVGNIWHVKLRYPYAYLVSNNQLDVVDLHNLGQPHVAGSLSGYPYSLSVGPSGYLYVAGLGIVDVSDPSNPFVARNDFPLFGTYLESSDQFLAVGTTNSSLELYETSDPIHPLRCGELNTYGSVPSMVYCGERYFYCLYRQGQGNSLVVYGYPHRPSPNPPSPMSAERRAGTAFEKSCRWNVRFLDRRSLQ